MEINQTLKKKKAQELLSNDKKIPVLSILFSAQIQNIVPTMLATMKRI